MDIEAIVKKHLNAWRVSTVVSPESCIRAALTELAAEYEQKLNKIQSNNLMAECMEQTRSDLIAAGVIDKTCAPMFLADAVISRVRNLEQKDYTGGDAELLRERIRQLEAERVPEGWVPVSERLPDSGVSFLAVTDCAGDIHISTMRLPVLIAKNEKQSGEFIRERVTHWMPLPAAPHQQKEGS